MPAPFDLVPKLFWGTTFFSRLWPEHPAEAAAIAGKLYELKAREAQNIASGVAPSAKSPYGLFESNFDLFDVDHPGLNKLKAFIVDSLQLAIALVNGSEVEPRQIEISLVDSWFHITNDGGFHDAHFHGSCSWCGIYYLQVGDTAMPTGASAPNGGNRFYSPLGVGGGYNDYGNKYLDRCYVDPPARDGMLILFPSYLLHSALPYRGGKDRLIISFNSRALLAPS